MENRFDPENLDKVFSNLEKFEDRYTNCSASYFCVNEKGDRVDSINFLTPSEMRIHVDNFPHQKKFYSSNLPIQSIDEFQKDIERTGLKLKRIDA